MPIARFFCHCRQEFEGDPPITCRIHGDGLEGVEGGPPEEEPKKTSTKKTTTKKK